MWTEISESMDTWEAQGESMCVEGGSMSASLEEDTTSVKSPHALDNGELGNAGRPLKEARWRHCRAVRSAAIARDGADGGRRRRAREARSRLANPDSLATTFSRAALPERHRCGLVVRSECVMSLRPCGVETTVRRAQGKVGTGPGGA